MRLGVGVIIGAQVGETSTLTRAGLTVMQAARPSLVAAEGAFGTHLLREDLTTESLMFDDRGVLTVPDGAAPGLGLAVREEMLDNALQGRGAKERPFLACGRPRCAAIRCMAPRH